MYISTYTSKLLLRLNPPLWGFANQRPTDLTLDLDNPEDFKPDAMCTLLKTEQLLPLLYSQDLKYLPRSIFCTIYHYLMTKVL